MGYSPNSAIMILGSFVVCVLINHISGKTTLTSEIKLDIETLVSSQVHELKAAESSRSGLESNSNERASAEQHAIPKSSSGSQSSNQDSSESNSDENSREELNLDSENKFKNVSTYLKNLHSDLDAKQNPQGHGPDSDLNSENMSKSPELRSESVERKPLNCSKLCGSSFQAPGFDKHTCRRRRTRCISSTEGGATNDCACRCTVCIVGLGAECDPAGSVVCQDSLMCVRISRGNESLFVCRPSTLEGLRSLEPPQKTNKETFGSLVTYFLIVFGLIIFVTSTIYLFIAIRKKRHIRGLPRTSNISYSTRRFRTGGTSGPSTGPSREFDHFPVELPEGRIRLLNNPRLEERIAQSMHSPANSAYRDSVLKWFERQAILEQLQRMLGINVEQSIASVNLDLVSASEEYPAYPPPSYSSSRDLSQLDSRVGESGYLQVDPPTYTDTVRQMSRPPSYRDIATTAV